MLNVQSVRRFIPGTLEFRVASDARIARREKQRNQVIQKNWKLIKTAGINNPLTFDELKHALIVSGVIQEGPNEDKDVRMCADSRTDYKHTLGQGRHVAIVKEQQNGEAVYSVYVDDIY